MTYMTSDVQLTKFYKNNNKNGLLVLLNYENMSLTYS